MLQSIILSCIGGILFGLSFVNSKKVLFLQQNHALHALISTIRLLLFSFFLYIMLKTMQINPIILVVSFLLGYWLVILKYKETLHG